jgi:hypothetical protein
MYIPMDNGGPAGGAPKPQIQYHEALYKCGIRYEAMEEAKGRGDTQALADFIKEFMAGCLAGAPIPKLCRWLGYIQGVLISKGMTTVEAERDWTRPYFRPLDFPEA